MNNQSKAVSIILYLIWPFSAIIIGIKNFDSAFGRKLLIAAFVFLGYVAIDSGDLERYAAKYYEISNHRLDNLIELFINLQISKFFNDFTAILFSPFDNHHLYFAFLFGFYGYFLINAINLIRISILKKAGFPVLIGFVTFAFFYSVLTVFNYAFYTGAIYFLYFLLKIILSKRKKRHFFFIALTPLFHMGLVPLLLVPIFYIAFQQRTILYILVLIIFTILSQSFIVQNIEARLENSDTILEKRYHAYASDEGRDRMETRYAEGYQSGNFNYRFFRDVREVTNKIAIPLLLLFLYINKKKITNASLLDLFNISIACMAITNLMLNISQGERFFFISGFMVLGAYVYYIQTTHYSYLKFKSLLFISLPFILLNNTVSLVIIKNLISSDFLLNNFPFMFFRLL